MVTQLIPDNPVEQATVPQLLREHPEVTEYIKRAVRRAKEIFPGARFTLESHRYDEWDPPLTLIIDCMMPFDLYWEAREQFTDWLVKEPGYDYAVLFMHQHGQVSRPAAHDSR